MIRLCRWDSRNVALKQRIVLWLVMTGFHVSLRLVRRWPWLLRCGVRPTWWLNNRFIRWYD